MDRKVHKKHIHRIIKALADAEDAVVEAQHAGAPESKSYQSSFEWGDVFYGETLEVIALALDEILTQLMVSEKNIDKADSQVYTTKLLLKSLSNIKRNINV